MSGLQVNPVALPISPLHCLCFGKQLNKMSASFRGALPVKSSSASRRAELFPTSSIQVEGLP